MRITRVSKLTGIKRTFDLEISQEQFNFYLNGMVIQHAMPNLTPSEREFFISGIVEEEWNEMFPLEDDKDIDDNVIFKERDIGSEPPPYTFQRKRLQLTKNLNNDDNQHGTSETNEEPTEKTKEEGSS